MCDTSLRIRYNELRLESEGTFQPVDRRRRIAITETRNDGGNGILGRRDNLTTKRTMTAEFSHALPRWSIGAPIAAMVALAIVWSRPLEWALITVVALALVAAVLAAVDHAEVVALRVGEPFGTLILAVAVTVIDCNVGAAARDRSGCARRCAQPIANQPESRHRIGDCLHRLDHSDRRAPFDRGRPAASSLASQPRKRYYWYTFVVAVLTLGSGRATVMHGAVHLVLFAAFIFLAFFP